MSDLRASSNQRCLNLNAGAGPSRVRICPNMRITKLNNGGDYPSWGSVPVRGDAAKIRALTVGVPWVFDVGRKGLMQWKD